MKTKTKNKLRALRRNIVKYISSNRLFLTFILLTTIETILVRNYTVGKPFSFRPLICDIGLLIIIGSFGYFIKPKKQFHYYFIWMIVITLTCLINSIYYVFYTSFTSFSLLAELGQVGEVSDSLLEKFRFVDIVYLFFPIIYWMIHSKLKKDRYYFYVSKIEKPKRMFLATIITGFLVLSLTFFNVSKQQMRTDASRLVKQWDRQYLVQRFGIVLYQGNDLLQSLTPKINSMFGYDNAAKKFKDYYNERLKNSPHKKNKYTNVLEGMNVIFIHMESIHDYLVDMKINGEEVTPTINKLSKEGMYFNNFYPQISTGTSSDTEFTLNTSLMPSSSGTVFVQYYDREYLSIPKELKKKGYYTFSSHANGKTMWNRAVMHPRLGYDDMYFQDTFDYDKKVDCLGLGLNDEAFFKQLQAKLEKIETEHKNYMGTLIQLSNHSPYAATDKHPEKYFDLGKLTLTNTYTVENENGEQETVTDSYLEGRKLGNYLISAHYSDLALGTFFDYVRNSPYYNNTVFVLYGDHEARLEKKEYQYYYNYDTATGKVREEGDPGYVDYNKFTHEVNKDTPLIIWTKNKKVAKKINIKNENVMGMYDVMPTLANMMNFDATYALGHDIYDIKDKNVVIQPTGNFITNKIFYHHASGNYLTLNKDQNIVIDEDYVSSLKQYTEEILDISNSIIVHDLFKKELPNLQNENRKDTENGQIKN